MKITMGVTDPALVGLGRADRGSPDEGSPGPGLSSQGSGSRKSPDGHGLCSGCRGLSGRRSAGHRSIGSIEGRSTGRRSTGGGSAGRGPAARRPAADRGSATVWLLAAMLGVLTAGGLALAVTTVGAVREQAFGAADLAALAAASDRSADPAQACRRAGRIAEGGGARLTACQVAGSTVDVVVTVALPGPLAPFGPVVARARAGPWEGAPDAYRAFPDADRPGAAGLAPALPGPGP